MIMGNETKFWTTDSEQLSCFCIIDLEALLLSVMCTHAFP